MFRHCTELKPTLFCFVLITCSCVCTATSEIYDYLSKLQKPLDIATKYLVLNICFVLPSNFLMLSNKVVMLLNNFVDVKIC